MAFDLVGGATSNEALDARAGATDQARASGGKQSPLTTDRARAATGKKSKIVEGGGVDFSGAKDVKFGPDFSGVKGNVSLTNTGIDPKDAFANSSALADSFSSTIKDLSAKQSELLESVLNNQSAPTQESSPGTTESEPETDDKAATRAKGIKLLLIIGGLAVAAWLYLRK